MDSINSRIAEELGVRPQQVEAAVALLDEGSTVPFIARYRKEVTGSLDDTQLRHLEERLRYLRELDERRISILASIEEQGKLTPELARDIKLADTKTRLEDLYLPYKQKRRTKGQIALEAGLGELADALFNDPSLTPEAEAARFIDAEKGFADLKAVLEGAKYILMERFAEDATLLEKLRSFLKHEAVISARVVAGKEEEGAKFRDYFEHDEPLKSMPSHRALAIFRGRNEGILSSALKVGEELPGTLHPCEMMISERFGLQNRNRAADKWLGEVVRWTWKVKLYSHLETDLLGELREGAEAEANTLIASASCWVSCAKVRKPKRSTCSPTTCTTCCWPPPLARALPWAWTRACAPAARSPWSIPQASCWTTQRSIRMCRKTSGIRPSPFWPLSVPSIRSI